MHELTIATGLLETVLHAAEKDKAEQIVQVDLEIGQLAGVMVDSLKFCFESIKSSTPLKNTRLIIHEIPGIGLCSDCNKRSDMNLLTYICPHCHCFGITIIQGEEVKVRSIMVE